jgi:hypothetical protein
VPLDGDMTTITKRAEEFKDHDESISRNLHVFLPLTMEILHRQHENIKRSIYSETGRQAVCPLSRLQGLTLIAAVDFGCVADKIEVVDGVCWDAQIPYVGGCVRATGENGRGYRIIVYIVVLSILQIY